MAEAKGQFLTPKLSCFLLNYKQSCRKQGLLIKFKTAYCIEAFCCTQKRLGVLRLRYEPSLLF
ncbi:hypothetical protein EVA_11770 [gut metagenome]|uniref:Uncharacterized protein n=1 Tax=gut metagenome TaxID=749906 RepID=J9GEC8_9ZZZZ